MGTGILSSLAHAFPYGGSYNPVLRGFFMFFFMLNVVFWILIAGCTIARYVMFPEVSFMLNYSSSHTLITFMMQVWPQMLNHPAQSMFIGAFPMGSATLINSGIVRDIAHHPLINTDLRFRSLIKSGAGAVNPSSTLYGAFGGSTRWSPTPSPLE
jgi:tellurite resistance protein TehA-like permease